MFRQLRTYNHYTPQLLWDHIQPSQNYSIYNGGVEAVSNLLGRAYHIKIQTSNVIVTVPIQLTQ